MKHSLTHFCLLSVLMIPVAAQSQIDLQQKPLVTYTVNKQELTELKAGKLFSIEVELSVEPGWYIYAPTGSNAAQGMIETQVVFTLPEGLNKAGRMHVPDATLKDGYEVFTGGEITLSQPIKAKKPGVYVLKGRIVYQTCSTGVCMPPLTEHFETTVTIN